MHITILNGSPKTSTNMDSYLVKIEKELKEYNNQVSIFHLRKLNINYCGGCYGCWLKTPGKCLLSDDMEEIYPEILVSDLLVFASPIKMGFPTALIKAVQDRLLPFLHPYFEINQNKIYHKARYDLYPQIGLLLAEEEDTDAKDWEIIKNVYQKYALQYRTKLAFCKNIEMEKQELHNAISTI